MKNCKKIGIDDYNSPFYYNPKEDIKKLVDKEARLEYGFSNTGELKEIKVERQKWSFLKSTLTKLEYLRP